MSDGTKTVNDMPKPERIKAKDTGTKMIAPVGPVEKGSFDKASLAGNISASATPKAGPGQAVTKEAAKPQAPAGGI